MDENKNYLIKHSAAIHITNKISLLDRKIFNICLKNAFGNLVAQNRFIISLSNLKKELGWSEKSNNNNDLKESLRNLVTTSVEWNVLEKDKAKSWGIFSLLSAAKIVRGELTYEYCEDLKSYLSNPNIYARLNMAIQRDITSKHALALWEFLTEAVARNKSKTSAIELSIEQLKRLLGIDGDKSCYGEFKRINEKILKPACEELNKVSELGITIEYIKKNRKVNALIFHILKKHGLTDERKQKLEDNVFLLGQNNITVLAKEVGVSENCLNKLVAIHSEQEILKSLLYMNGDNIKPSIKNKDAYLVYMLKHEILLDKDTKEENEISNEALESKLLTFGDCYEISKIISHKLGASTFITWFSESSIYYEENTLVITFKNRFARDQVENNFGSIIKGVIDKNLDLEFKYG